LDCQTPFQGNQSPFTSTPNSATIGMGLPFAPRTLLAASSRLIRPCEEFPSKRPAAMADSLTLSAYAWYCALEPPTCGIQFQPYCARSPWDATYAAGLIRMNGTVPSFQAARTAAAGNRSSVRGSIWVALPFSCPQ
jgi:hypothetical protein